MRVTIKDVARAAHVSLRTAYRALNHEEKVYAETRERVINAAARLDYQPNVHARNLARRRTHRLGVIFPDSRNPLFGEFTTAIEQRAQAMGYECLFLYSEVQPEREIRLMKLALEGSVDGLILFPLFLIENRAYYDRLLANRIPLVMCWAPFELFPEIDIINVDLLQGGFLAAHHLLSMGHRGIGILIPERHLHVPCCRLLVGYEQAHAEFGVPVNPQFQVEMTRSIESAYIAIRRLLETIPETTALICPNDYQAMASFRAAREAGRRIPDDLAVIGFDDLDLCRYYEVPLTTISHSVMQESQMLADLICTRINHPDLAPRQIMLQPELIIRESCGYKTRRPAMAAPARTGERRRKSNGARR